MQMENQDIEDNPKSNHHLLLKTHLTEDIFLNSAEIDGTLGKLSRFFNDRIGVADREMVTFCLRHIFYNVNQMYTLFLPELTRCNMETADAEEDHLRIQNMPTRNMPIRNIIIQYQIWSLLQEIEAALERLEPLCQLVISATTTMLNELDRTCSIEDSTRQAEQQIGKKAIEHQAQSADESQARRDESDEWQWGLAQMKMKMSTWLKNNESQPSFSIQFAILEPMIPALPQIDIALNILLKSSYAIFGDILPDFQENETDEDEKVTILLLDIIQRCDQILLQIGILVEPLHILTDQYTLETTI